MSIPLVWVKARPDRVAYTAPKGGRLIPTADFVQVQKTPWIVRLIDVHGDLEVKSESKVQPEPFAIAAPETPPADAAPRRRATNA